MLRRDERDLERRRSIKCIVIEIATVFLPDLPSQKRVDGVQPIVHLFVEQGLQQISAVLRDDTKEPLLNVMPTRRR